MCAASLPLEGPGSGAHEIGEEPHLQVTRRHGADDAVDDAVALDDDHGGDAAGPELLGQHGVLVDVHLDDLESPGVLACQPLEHGADHATGTAPRCPEVNEDRHGGPCLVREGGVRGVHDPRQRLAAGAAVGRAALAGADLVLLAAVGTDEDGEGAGNGGTAGRRGARGGRILVSHGSPESAATARSLQGVAARSPLLSRRRAAGSARGARWRAPVSPG
jgi:hypothetical protein